MLFALGIRFVGAGVARKLADGFGSIDELLNSTADKLEELDEIGPRISNSVIRFFRDPINLDLINRLRTAGLQFKTEESSRVNQKLNGNTFVLTGTLVKMTRKDAEEEIISLGGKSTSSISKNTSYLIVGENPGSKLEKAKNLGVKILTEEEFIKLITLN